jgi:hypothetical protein
VGHPSGVSARLPLPGDLPISGFTVSAARAAGAQKHRLHALDLARPHWGVRTLAAVDVTLGNRCRLLTLALPAHAFFSGGTAAALIGIPVPQRYESARATLEVAVAAPARAIRRQGVRGRRLQISDTDVTTWRGIRLTTPARTWCDLASLLTLGELVAAGDYLIFHERPIVTRTQLAAAIEHHPGRRWRGKLKQALELLSDRSESPRESILRVIVVTHGFPAPLVNVSIYDEHGRFVARVDLLFADYREIFEYQGDHHRTDIRQWRRDISRKAEVESLDYHITEISADDLTNVNHLIRRLERNLKRRGWTGHAAYDP